MSVRKEVVVSIHTLRGRRFGSVFSSLITYSILIPLRKTLPSYYTWPATIPSPREIEETISRSPGKVTPPHCTICRDAGCKIAVAASTIKWKNCQSILYR
jgi:hypothetical protein